MSTIPEYMKSEYPEHMKLALIVDKSQVIGEFLDWVEEKHNAILCQGGRYDYIPLYATKEKLLAEFFEIDMDKVEAEKREMLRKMAELNGEETTP